MHVYCRKLVQKTLEDKDKAFIILRSKQHIPGTYYSCGFSLLVFPFLGKRFLLSPKLYYKLTIGGSYPPVVVVIFMYLF